MGVHSQQSSRRVSNEQCYHNDNSELGHHVLECLYRKGEVSHSYGKPHDVALVMRVTSNFT